MAFDAAVVHVTGMACTYKLTIYWTDDRVRQNSQRVKRGDLEAERDSDKNTVFCYLCLHIFHTCSCVSTEILSIAL